MTRKDDFKRLLRLEPVAWDLQLSEEDLLTKTPPPELLFGTIPFERVLLDLEEQGIAQALRHRGYTDWTPELGYGTPYDAHFRMWGQHPAATQRQLLMDVRTRQGVVRVDEQSFRALVWEWISLQDPMADFPPGMEPLPGQEHPGLGQFRVLLRLMLGYVSELNVEALVAVPEFFHNAVLYSTHMQFYEPEREGQFQAMRRDLLPYGMACASRAVDQGQVEWDGPADQLWPPAEQICPMQPAVAAHFENPDYRRVVERSREETSYRLVAPPRLEEAEAR